MVDRVFAPSALHLADKLQVIIAQQTCMLDHARSACDLSCMYLAHHELESVLIVVIIIMCPVSMLATRGSKCTCYGTTMFSVWCHNGTISMVPQCVTSVLPVSYRW